MIYEEKDKTLKKLISSTSNFARDIQWQFADNDVDSDSEWIDFNLYLNAIIEEAFNKKQSQVYLFLKPFYSIN